MYPSIYTNEDLNLVAESVSAGMKLMTFDIVVKELYNVISEYYKVNEEKE